MSKRIVFAAPEKVELQDYTPKPVEAGEVMIENLYTVTTVVADFHAGMHTPLDVNRNVIR